MPLSKGDANKVVSAIKSRIGKNTYTQGPRRNDVDKGFGDCSASVRWAYKQIGVEVGGFTGDQIKRGELVDKGPVMGDSLNLNNLLPGDLIFYKGSASPSDFRPYGVGHVEMYIGDNKVCGHGGGMGPSVKNMTTFMRKQYIMAKRYVINEGQESKVALPDVNIAISPNILKVLDNLVSESIIKSPEYWKSRLMNYSLVGETFGIFRNLYQKFVPNATMNNNTDFKLNAIQFLFDNKIINSPQQWIKNVSNGMPVWAGFVILMNIHRILFPDSIIIDTKDYKFNGMMYCVTHGIIDNPTIWSKKIDDGIIVWELMSMIYELNSIIEKKLILKNNESSEMMPY